MDVDASSSDATRPILDAFIAQKGDAASTAAATERDAALNLYKRGCEDSFAEESSCGLAAARH